jgi:hypothetical protein
MFGMVVAECGVKRLHRGKRSLLGEAASFGGAGRAGRGEYQDRRGGSGSRLR